MLIGLTRTHRQVAAVLPEEAVEEARVERGRMPLVNRYFWRAELVDEARDEVEDLLLALAGHEAGELGAQKLASTIIVSMVIP